MAIWIVWAQDEARGVGTGGALPWHLPDELQVFKRLTFGRTIVVGRKTWESLPVLPGRRVAVLSSERPEGVELWFPNVEAVLAYAGSVNLMVAGGAALLEQFMPYAERLYVSNVKGVFDADCFAPEIPDAFVQERVLVRREGFETVMFRRWPFGVDPVGR